MSFNQATLVGHVGKDPEIRSTNGGDRIATFSLATSESWKDRHTNERKETTEWHRIVVFNDGLVKVIEDYVAKGSQIMVQGQIKTRKWQDQSGNDRYSTEIVLGKFNGTLKLLGKREGGGGSNRDEHSYGTTRDRNVDSGRGFDAGQGFQAELDDEIPF